MVLFRRCLCALVLSLFLCASAHAQSFEAGVHVAASQWSDFKGTDTGVGGRMGWSPLPLIGLEAELTWYPSTFPDGVGFSRSRLEGLFGATAGPRLNRVRPYLKVAGGFLRVGATPGGFACIAIFPPPLACVLAGGPTLPAYDIGGGVAIDVMSRIVVRAELTDRVLRYPGPTFRSGLSSQVDDDFFAGALKVSVGAGWRF